jgi:hypothetical protein
LCFKGIDEEHWMDCDRLTSDGGVPIGPSWTRAATAPLPAGHAPSPHLVSTRSGARFLLLVEKEGVFRRLCQEQLHK